MINPKSLANLKPAKKGECRNPGGKPKGLKDRITKIKEAFCDAFDQNEFKKWADTHKNEFYPLIVKIMPKELELNPGESGIIINFVSFDKGKNANNNSDPGS